MSQALKVNDHQKLRSWADGRGGRSARVASTAGDGGEGVLRFDLADKDGAVKEISWDEFFKTFDDNDLALLEQGETAEGETSRFTKFVTR